MIEIEPTDELKNLADGCARMVFSKLGIELDYTPDTLPLLDHYLRLAREAVDTTVDDHKLDALLDLLGVPAGAYFAEVVRRHHPARVVMVDSERWRVEFEHVFLHFNPVGMAREALRQEDEFGSNAHFAVLPKDAEMLQEGLTALGQIDSDDYFALTTRYETLLDVLSILQRKSSSEQANVATVAQPSMANNTAESNHAESSKILQASSPNESSVADFFSPAVYAAALSTATLGTLH